jgi:hypothetical protein
MRILPEMRTLKRILPEMKPYAHSLAVVRPALHHVSRNKDQETDGWQADAADNWGGGRPSAARTKRRVERARIAGIFQAAAE